jgi:Flp pilus assembly protein TadG
MMRSPRFHFPLLPLARRFLAEREGVAAVEFALILPFLIFLWMGSVELSQVLAVDRRISTIAGSLSDLVARTEDELPIGTLNDYFTAAEQLIIPYESGELTQIVTCVYVDEDGDTEVMWSYGYNGGTAHTVGAAYELPDELTGIATDTYVIVAEAGYSYTPLLGYVFDTPFSLYKEFFNLPRYGTFIDVT